MREEELTALLDSAMDAVVVLNANGGITRVNPAAERLFGCTAEDLLGENLRDFLPPFVSTMPPGYNNRPIGVFSTFFPARNAQILMNGEAASGKPWLEKRGDRDAASACLAWSGSWVKPKA